MGNKYSVVREEEEEAEYAQLVRTVQAAQKRAQREVDLEANIDLNDQRHTRRPHYSHHVASPPVAVSQTVYSPAHNIASPSSFVNIANPSSAENSMVMTDAKAGDILDERVHSPSQSVVDSALREHREYEDPQHIEPLLPTLRRTTTPPASSSHHRYRKGLSVQTEWMGWTDGSPRTEGGLPPTAHSRSPSPARVPVARDSGHADFIEEDHDEEGVRGRSVSHLDPEPQSFDRRRSPSLLEDAEAPQFHSKPVSSRSLSLRTPSAEISGTIAYLRRSPSDNSVARQAHQNVSNEMPDDSRCECPAEPAIACPSADSIRYCSVDSPAHIPTRVAPHDEPRLDSDGGYAQQDNAIVLSRSPSPEILACRTLTPTRHHHLHPTYSLSRLTFGSSALVDPDTIIIRPEGEVSSRETSRSSSPVLVFAQQCRYCPIAIQPVPHPEVSSPEVRCYYQRRISLSPHPPDVSSSFVTFPPTISTLLERVQSQEEQLARVADLLSNALVRRQPGTLGKHTRAASLLKRYAEKYASEVDFANGTEFMLEKDVDLDIKPYPDLPYAAGLRTGKKCSQDGQWQPVWAVFPLKVFRGGDWAYLKIQPHWEDERVLRELSKTYDRLRTV